MFFIRKEIKVFIKRMKDTPQAFHSGGDFVQCKETAARLEAVSSGLERIYRFAGRNAESLTTMERRALLSALRKFKSKDRQLADSAWLAGINPPKMEND